jgi:predicted outer membrane protein
MSHCTIRRTTLLAATFAIGLAGCDRQEGATSQQSTTPATTELAPGGVTAPASPTASEIAPSAEAEAIAADVSSLKAPGQAAVLRAIDQRILDEAKLAEQRSGSGQIKRVAHELVRLHHDDLSTEQSMFARMHVRPAGNPISHEIDGDAEGGLQAMRGLKGQTFDGYFLDEEIRAHAQGVEVIDRMFPAVKGSELQAEILRSRTGLTAYLATLTDMQKSTGVAEMQGGTGSAVKP